jgi:hypothetical protein
MNDAAISISAAGIILLVISVSAIQPGLSESVTFNDSITVTELNASCGHRVTVGELTVKNNFLFSQKIREPFETVCYDGEREYVGLTYALDGLDPSGAVLSVSAFDTARYDIWLSDCFPRPQAVRGEASDVFPSEISFSRTESCEDATHRLSVR